MEAIYEFDVQDMPVTVAVDSRSVSPSVDRRVETTIEEQAIKYHGVKLTTNDGRDARCVDAQALDQRGRSSVKPTGAITGWSRPRAGMPVICRRYTFPDLRVSTGPYQSCGRTGRVKRPPSSWSRDHRVGW